MDGRQFYQKVLDGCRLGGAYYLCGEESYFLEKAASAIAARVNPDTRDMNLTLLTAPSFADVQNACDTLPFFDEQRVVTVRNFDADAANALADYVLNVPSSTILLLLRAGKPPEKNALYKTLHDLRRAMVFAPLDAYAASDLLKQTASEQGVELDDAARNLLVQYVGCDPRALISELMKAAAYAGFGRRVDRGTVMACVEPSPAYKVFAVMDKLWAGEREAGMRELVALANSPSENPMGLATLFERNVRLVFAAKQLLLDGLSEQQAVRALGGADFVAKRAVRNAKGRSIEQLREALMAFAAIELQQKTGQMQAADALILACSRHF